ncbi:MAG: hypothetical protein QXG97_02720 [Nitrososphaerota archaeon]
MSLRGLAASLLREAELIEAAGERQRHEEEERQRAIQIERLRREQARREAEEALRTFRERMEEATAEKRAEYMTYYERYHNIESVADVLREKLLSGGLTPLRVDVLVRGFMTSCLSDWPEPYRSRCHYTKEEMLAFLSNPYEAAMWVSWLNR